MNFETIKQALVRWFVLTISVWVAAFIVPGIHYTSLPSLLAAALVLGILNTFVKPLLTILSFPFILVTLGLFMLVINTLLLLLTSKLVTGFYISSFWSALGGAILISIVGLFMSRSREPVEIKHEPQVRFHREDIPKKSSPPPGKGPVIDID